MDNKALLIRKGEDAKIFMNIYNEMCGYVDKNVKALVLGVSGGIDSAVTAALAAEVADKLGIRLVFAVLPTKSNSEEENVRAVNVAKAFGSSEDSVMIYKDLTDITDFMIKNLLSDEGDITDSDDKVSKIRRGNLKARTRMIKLYDLARKHNGIVLSTDNLTEFFLGFWTINGDVGDFGPIQQLWKTEVYSLANWMAEKYEKLARPDRCSALKACVSAVPTDGLGISVSDMDQINPGGTYFDVDLVLMDYLRKGYGDMDDPVIKRYESTHFKREIPIIINREKILSD